MLRGSAGLKLSFKSSVEKGGGDFEDVACARLVGFLSSIASLTAVVVGDILLARKENLIEW